VKYRFINEHRHEYGVATMCQVLGANRAGFYAWLHNPLSDRAIEDQRLLTSIRDSHTASGRVFADLRENDLPPINRATGKLVKSDIEGVVRH
jgi:putative transposase